MASGDKQRQRLVYRHQGGQLQQRQLKSVTETAASTQRASCRQLPSVQREPTVGKESPEKMRVYESSGETIAFHSGMMHNTVR